MSRVGFFLAWAVLASVLMLPCTAAETNNATERMDSLSGFLKDYTTVIDVAQQQVSTSVAAQMREWRAEQQVWQSKQENQQQQWQADQQLLFKEWQMQQQRAIDEMHNFPFTLAKALVMPVAGLLGTFLTWVFRDALGVMGRAAVAAIGIKDSERRALRVT